MSSRGRGESRRIVFVSRSQSGESLRSARAIGRLSGVQLLGISEQMPNGENAQIFSDRLCIDNIYESDQMILAARRLANKHGDLDQIVTTTETLLEPVARANEALGLRGTSVSAVCRTLDKSRMKSILAKSGIPVARDCIITSNEDARGFVAQVGFPIVLKPLKGSGGLATWCIRGAEQLDLALRLMQVSKRCAVLAEEFLGGQEICIDTITLADEPQFHSICCYRPSILEALEDPRIQWSCVLPRDATGVRYQDFVQQGLQAVRALSIGNAMTHMEGFLEGSRLCFTDATLRPAGARIAPMLAFAYDIDPYLAWARIAVDGCYDGPWERKYAVGTVFLRGIGSGKVASVLGIESVPDNFGDILVESRLPRTGAEKSATYTGDGYITVRHPKTQVVEEALQIISQTVQITYSQPDLTTASIGSIQEQWSHQIRRFDRDLNRPAWDDDSPPSLDA